MKISHRDRIKSPPQRNLRILNYRENLALQRTNWSIEHFQSVFSFVPNNSSMIHLVQQEHCMHCALIFYHILIQSHPNPCKWICRVGSWKVAESCVWCHLRLKSVCTHIINFDKKKLQILTEVKVDVEFIRTDKCVSRFFHWWSFILQPYPTLNKFGGGELRWSIDLHGRLAHLRKENVWNA